MPGLFSGSKKGGAGGGGKQTRKPGTPDEPSSKLGSIKRFFKKLSLGGSNSPEKKRQKTGPETPSQADATSGASDLFAAAPPASGSPGLFGRLDRDGPGGSSGPAGPAGRIGHPGVAGPPGPAGPSCPSGLHGLPGLHGAAGPAGPPSRARRSSRSSGGGYGGRGSRGRGGRARIPSPAAGPSTPSAPSPRPSRNSTSDVEMLDAAQDAQPGPSPIKPPTEPSTILLAPQYYDTPLNILYQDATQAKWRPRFEAYCKLRISSESQLFRVTIPVLFTDVNIAISDISPIFNFRLSKQPNAVYYPL
jgi:hypothetical protein